MNSIAGSLDLSGKVALVTGGGRGIGATTSVMLARLGADVAINYNASKEEAEKVHRKIDAMGRRVVSIEADVGEILQCQELVRRTEETFGRVDILVSNAGIGQRHTIVETPDEEWDRVMNVNARATFALVRELLPGMMERKYGRIVTISSSIAAYGTGGGSFSTYAASKAALIALTKGIAHEGAPYVTANTILPCVIQKHQELDEEKIIEIDGEKRLDWLGMRLLTGRTGQPEDIAHAIAYFASDASEYVTGQSLNVGGGSLMP